jgi:hypothetical protein
MDDTSNKVKIYQISVFTNRRHTKSHTNIYFLYPEHTTWALRDPCDCADCEVIRICLIEVDTHSDHYGAALRNSETYMASEENADEPKPLALQCKHWKDAYKHCEGVRNDFVEKLTKWRKDDTEILTYLTDSTLNGGTDKFKNINIDCEDDTVTRIKKLGEGYIELKEQFNNLLDLIKGANTPEQVKMLQNLATRRTSNPQDITHP